MADDAFFSRMHSGSVFINASRGEVVDESALLHALPKLGAVIIDTWCNEPRINRILLDAVDKSVYHSGGAEYKTCAHTVDRIAADNARRGGNIYRGKLRCVFRKRLKGELYARGYNAA